MVRNRTANNTFASIDWITVGVYLLLVFCGWANIYASVYNEDHTNIMDMSQKYGKQGLWIITAFAIAFIILIVDAEFYTSFAFPIFGLAILSLLAVLVVGKDVKGSRSWIYFGSTGVQPAEFAKFTVNLALAKLLSRVDIKFSDLSTKLYSSALILVPMLIIILQHETGVALVYGSFVLVLYREGLSGNLLLVGVFLVCLAIMALLFNKIYLIIGITILGGMAYFFTRRNRTALLTIGGGILISVFTILSANFAFEKLQGYQKTRINVFLGKEVDKDKTGYNVNQAKIAIGSGGFWGKGYLEGTQTKYDFVPEQDTDFIFCTVGEEWGFAGSVTVIGIFLFLIIRVITLAERQRSLFTRIYGYGVASILFFHLIINIEMTR